MTEHNVPGCFGLAIAFDTQSQTCIECPHNRSCASRSCDSLLEIHQQTDVTDYLEAMRRTGLEVDIAASQNALPRQHAGKVKAKRGKVPTMKLDLLTNMSKGAKTLAEKMLKIEPDIDAAIQQQRNPYCGIKPSYLADVFDMVMKQQFTKHELVGVLSNSNPTWSENTVRSHYHSVINALVGLQIIEQRGKYFSLRGIQ